MKIGELAERTGTTPRQVRFMIAEGFVHAPRGGRANADYGEDHLAAVNRYLRLRELGFPPAAITVLLQSGAGAPFPVAPGITLVVTPENIGQPLDVPALTRKLQAGLTSVAASAPEDVSVAD